MSAGFGRALRTARERRALSQQQLAQAAGLDPAVVALYERGEKLTKRGPNTITSKRALREELEEIQAAGFAVDDQELAADVYAIAVPVRNEARDVVVAVALAAPSSAITLEEIVDALGPHVVSTADRISARLGYRRDDEQPRG